MRLVVAMSGGVDSSVAAALLTEQGHDVIGLSMQLYDQSGPEAFGSCCSLDDLYDARRVASSLGFPHYIVNFERAQGLGATHVATGHYARVEQRADGRWLLKRSADAAKDQSYFLFSLTQAQLARAVFPVGALTKPQVR